MTSIVNVAVINGRTEVRSACHRMMVFITWAEQA